MTHFDFIKSSLFIKATLVYLAQALKIFFIVVVHIFTLNFFPYPFYFINVLFVWLFWILFIGSSKKCVLAIVAAIFLTELLSTTIFGIASVSAISSLALVSLFLNRFFTNKSFSVLIIFFVLGLLTRELFLFSFHIAFSGIAQNMPPLKQTIIDIWWKLALTCSLFVIFYSLFRRYIRSLNPVYVQRH